MSETDIVNLLKLRYAVYRVGCDKGLWTNLEDNAGKEYMKFLFPKSSRLALYNLMVNIVQKVHERYIPSDMYGLFKCPIQIEEELYDYIKKNLNDDIELGIEPLDYIKSMGTIACDPQFGAVYIGQLSENIDNTLRLIACHYANSFTNNCNCYPYFN